MLKDITEPEFDGVGVAVVHELNDEGEKVWNVYLVNFNNATLEGVLVSSRGYGEIDGEERQSSMLRHFLDKIGALDYSRIEPLHSDLFVLNNEYWVSFFLDGQLFDRKFVFSANSIKPGKLKHINLLDKNGILLM